MSDGQSAPVFCLMGPTAMGKTEIAIRLAEQFDLDLISVDSALVYRGLDIGTAKPEPEVLQRFPHALVDIVDPSYAYSVAEFVADAQREIDASQARGRTPLLVGGTMLYFKRLFDGLAALPQADPIIRERIDHDAAAVGWPALHRKLAEIDPAAAQRIAPADAQRIQRALEVYEITGEPITRLQQRAAADASPRTWASFALLTDDRATLHTRISERFDAMMRVGFVDEVDALLARDDVHADLPSMRAVGYRQIAAWRSGMCTREAAIADAKTATRRLAKRQHTWLRSMSEVRCFDPLERDPIDHISTLIGSTLHRQS